MHSSKTACWQTASTITLSRPHPIKTVQPSCFGAPLCFSFCFLSSLFFLNLKIESLTGIWYTLHRCTACHSVCCVLKLQQQSCFHVPRSGANHSHAVNAHTSSHVLVYIPSFSLAWHNTATTNISSTEVLFADFLILPSSRRCVNPPPPYLSKERLISFLPPTLPPFLLVFFPSRFFLLFEKRCCFHVKEDLEI